MPIEINSIFDTPFTEDFVFCNVLVENPEICKSIAEIATGRKIKKIIKMQNQKFIKKSLDGKGVRFDVAFEDDVNTIYDVEMQQSNQVVLPERTRYYQSLLDLETLGKGEGYESIKKGYIIFICTFDPFHKGLHKYVASTSINNHPDIKFEDGMEKIFLNSQYKEEDIDSDTRMFLDYVRMGIVKNSLTSDIEGARKNLLSNEERRAEFMDFLERCQMERAEGISEGIAEGRAEERYTIIKNALKNGMSKEDIIRLLNVSSDDVDKALAGS